MEGRALRRVKLPRLSALLPCRAGLPVEQQGGLHRGGNLGVHRLIASRSGLKVGETPNGR